MLDIKELFAKKTTNATEDIPKSNSDKMVASVSNWYSDRYNSILIQRNFLLLLLIMSVIVVLVSAVITGNVASNFKVQPFVIEVEDKTGITSIVNPLANRDLISNQVLNQYFVTRYIKSRESYNSETWKYNYLTVVRLLSNSDVYRNFRRIINGPDGPLVTYGNQTSISVAFRSIQFFDPGNDPTMPNDEQVVARITLFPDIGNLRGVVGNKIEKIITLTYRYQQTEMNADDRSENPLGFFITSYRSDIENEVIPVVNGVSQ